MEARPDFKNMSIKKKLAYVWDYYRFHIGGIIVLAIVFGSIFHHYATMKESVMTAVFINGHSPYEGLPGLDEFFASQGFDEATQEINITTSLRLSLTEESYQADYYTLESLNAMFAVGDMDIFAAPYQLYNQFAPAGYVADLRIVFSEEELSAYEDILLYAVSTETGEEMPCGFDMSKNRWLKEYEYYSEENCHMGIPANSDNPQIAKEFLLYLLNY